MSTPEEIIELWQSRWAKADQERDEMLYGLKRLVDNLDEGDFIRTTRIDEYDGSESIEYKEDNSWTVS